MQLLAEKAEGISWTKEIIKIKKQIRTKERIEIITMLVKIYAFKK